MLVVCIAGRIHKMLVVYPILAQHLWLQTEIDASNPHHGPGAVGASALQKALARIQGDAAERIMSKYTVRSGPR